MRLAIVGIRGLPNNYGGFETLAEYLVKYLSKEIDITVYCSSADMNTQLSVWNGAKLKYIPFSSHGAQGILYDSLSLLHAIFRNDKVLFLGFGGGYAMPLLKRWHKKIILNIGGLDWKRNKWSGFAQKVIRKAEALLVRHSGTIISDNVKIQRYIKDTYNKESTLIAYGGDQATHQPVTGNWLDKYPFLNGAYAFTVCRIQPDNNIDLILEVFKEPVPLPLVLVGNWDNSDYGRATKAKYLNCPNLVLLEAIYERTELDVLRSNCTIYVHGHSAGGTNPSLAEAMFLGLPVFAYASGYNEHTSVNKAFYFKTPEDLKTLVVNYEQLDLAASGSALQKFAAAHYRWEVIAAAYKQLIINV